MRGAYLFEAKGIQPWIAAGSRLADAVGASLLVDSLCRPDDGRKPGSPLGLLDAALAAADIDRAKVRFTRRAAGAFGLVLPGIDAAPRLRRFRRLWTLAVRQAAPGLPFAEAIGEGTHAAAALELAAGQLRARRAILAPPLPLAGPADQLSPRTGNPALRVAPPGTASDSADRQTGDAAQLLKRDVGRDRQLVEALVATARFWDPAHGTARWPLDLEADFPFRRGARALGVLVLDANRMGALLRGTATRLAKRIPSSVPPDAFDAAEIAMLDDLKALSEAIEQGTIAAAHRASRLLADAREEPLAYLPARPILLGGDDVTILLRADLAIDYAECFLHAFTDEVEVRIGDLRQREVVQEPTITACAGLALVGASQPFAQALRLAQDLCRHAKQGAKDAIAQDASIAVPAALSFARITTSLPERYEPHRMTGGLLASMNPYVVREVPERQDGHRGLATLAALAKLKRVLAKGGSRGSARELAGMMVLESGQAAARFARWQDVLKGRDPRQRTLHQELENAMSAFPGRDHRSQLAVDDLLGAGGATPLADVLAWLAVDPPEEGQAAA